MHRYTTLLCLSTTLLCGGAAAFDSGKALASYRESFADESGPVATDGTHLFVIVDSDVPPGVPGGAGRVALTETQKALIRWVDGSGDAAATPLASPFCPLLSDFVIPDIEFELPKVDSVVVENVVRGGHIRYATAIDLAPVEALRKEVAARKAAPRHLDEWVSLLVESQTNLRSDKDHELFLSLLGCPDALISARPTARCFGEGIDLVEMTAAISKWNPEKAGPSDCRRLLSIAPFFAPAWRSLAGVAERSKEWPEAIACLLAANAADPQTVNFVASCESAMGEGGSPAWKEFSSLLPRLVESGLDANSTNSLWRYVSRTAGHLAFSPTGRSDGGAFQEAMGLWKKGQNLPQILNLLRTSLEFDPSRAEAWKYLGAALRTSNKLEQALVAYNESLLLAPDDVECIAYQAMLYQALGCPALASGAAWRVLIANPPEKTANLVRPILLTNYPHAILK